MAVKFTAVNLTTEGRDALRHAAVVVSAELGRRVSMSDALMVIKAVADRHKDEFADIAAEVLATDETEEEGKINDAS